MAKSKQRSTQTAPIATTTELKKSSSPSFVGRWGIAGVLLIVFMVFYPSLSSEFVNWDDDVNILLNKNILSLDSAHLKAIFSSDVIGNYNPLPILTFALEYHFVGFDPWLYHLDNILLHLLVVFLVFQIVRKLGMQNLPALLVAMLFGIHPMRVESVSWVTERKDVLFASFYFLALYFYVLQQKDQRKELKFPLLISGAFILSLLSKIQAVSLPLSMLAIDFLLNGKWTKKDFISKIPYFLLSLFFGLLGFYFLRENHSLVDKAMYPLGGRIIIGAYSFCIYLLKFIWPYQMLPLYAYPEKLFGYMYIALIPMLLYLYMLYHAYRKGYRNLFFGMFFFLVNVMFVLQILGAGQGYLADRFTYIPYLGFFYILLWVAGKYSSSLTYAGFAIYLVLLGKFCIAQQEIWKNGEQLWTHVIEAGQNAPLPYNNRAIYYREHKQADKALADFQKALSLKPEAGTYNSCGKMFFDQGKIAQAIEYYNQAIRMKPNDDEYLVNRAVAFAASGKNTESLADFSAGLKINPQNLNAYLNRSLLFFITGRYEDAIADHTAYLALDSTKTELYYERGNCKAILKRYAEAIADFDTAIRSEPSKGLYYLERAKSYYYLNEKSNARADVQKAIQLGVSIPEDLKQTLLAP